MFRHTGRQLWKSTSGLKPEEDEEMCVCADNQFASQRKTSVFHSFTKSVLLFFFNCGSWESEWAGPPTRTHTMDLIHPHLNPDKEMPISM